MEERLEIDGTEGRLSMEVLGYTPIRLSRGFRTIRDRDDRLPDPAAYSAAVHSGAWMSCSKRGKCPSTRRAARTSAVMDATLQGFYWGRGDEFWKRPETWKAVDPGSSRVSSSKSGVRSDV
jgi:hypothetical protein